MRKPLSHRKWFHRLIHRKCWECDVPLERASTFYGWTCPRCGCASLEIVLDKRERDIRACWWLSPWSREHERAA